MLNVPRETIYKALFARLQALQSKTGRAGPFKWVTRQAVLWSAIAAERKPALVQLEPRENYAEPSVDPLVMNTLEVYLMIVADVKQYQGSDDNPPVAVLNALIDAVEAAIRPDAMQSNQTLGGLVGSLYITGQVGKDTGDLDGTAVAILPIKILVPA